MLNANSLKLVKKTLAASCSLAFLNSFLPSQEVNAASNAGTVLVCTQPGANVQEARNALANTGCVILSEVPCVSGNFTVLHVRPTNGNVAATVSSINAQLDPNIGTAETNFQTKTQFFNCGGWQRPTCTPNDPDYPSQWALQAMDWNDARCTLRLLGLNQRAVPRVTYIDSGMVTVSAGDEMTRNQQFNFVGGLIGVPEANFDSGNHGSGTSGITAATTNNSTFIAGLGSHNLPVKATMCRVSPDGASIDTLDVIRAMIWCVDNQATRGGPGAINLSVSADPPATYNASTVVQQIAQSAKRQGDVFVNAVGNSGLNDPSPEKYLRRVGATDENNMRASFSVTGPFKAHAPGVNILTFANASSLAYRTGTSVAAPNWTGVITLLQSLNPRLNAAKADAIVYDTCRTTPEGLRIPNVNRAVIAAVLFGWLY